MGSPLLSFADFVAAHPEWSAERAGRRWAARVFGAWDDGEAVPPALLEDLARRYPLFAPDPLASTEILLDRYAPQIARCLANELWRGEQAYQADVRKLEAKRIRTNPAKEQALYRKLETAHQRLEALREAQHRWAQGDRAGDLAQECLGRCIEARRLRRAKMQEHPQA